MIVLITGAFGKTAKPIIELLLKYKHQIIAFDLPTVHSPNWLIKENVNVITGDVCDMDSLSTAMKNADAVIHLAVLASGSEYIDNQELAFKVNVYGTYNVLLSAKKLNISKVIIASSAPVHTVGKLPPNSIFDTETDYICSNETDFTYDLTKHLQESMAKDFADTFSMNIIVLCLGHIVDGLSKTDLYGAPLNILKYCHGGWVCQYDVARAFLRALEVNLYGFSLFHIIGSVQAEYYFDMNYTKDVLGFTFNTNFSDYL